MYQMASSGIAGLTIGATAMETRPAQVEDQLNSLQVNAKDLTEIVARLESKLVSVIQPRPNPAGDNLKTPEPVLVPLAGKLKDVCRDVRVSVDRLRDLCGAIELSE